MERGALYSLTRWEPRSGSVRRSVVLALITVALVVASLVPLVRCLGAVVARIGYPFDLDWMESGVVSHMRMIRGGAQIYQPPSLEFTPYVYPPLYFYASAAASFVVGLGQLAPRLVSVISFIGCLLLIARWVRDLTGDAVSAFAALGVFTATYGTTEYWFDLARVDSLFLVQLLGAVTLLRSTGSLRRVVLGSVLLATACFTKQIGVPYSVVALAWLALVSWRYALVAAAVYSAIVTALFALFAVTSHGWFQYYVLEVPAHQPIMLDEWQVATQQYLWGALAPLSVAQMAFACRVGLARTPYREWVLQSALAVVSIATALAQYLKIGGYVNGFIPTYALFSVAFGTELAELRSARPRFDLGRQLFALVAIVGQCALLWYPAGAVSPDIARLIRSAVPTDLDVAVGKRAVQEIGRLPRPIWVTCSSDIARVAGQRAMVTHMMGLSDVMKTGDRRALQVHDALAKAITSHHFKTIVLDRAGGFLPFDLVALIRASYEKRGTVLPGAPETAFWTRSGAWVRPDEIWVAP